MYIVRVVKGFFVLGVVVFSVKLVANVFRRGGRVLGGGYLGEEVVEGRRGFNSYEGSMYVEVCGFRRWL